MKMLKIKHGSVDGYEDWIHYETGSWEDAGQPESGHVYCILQREHPDLKKVMEITIEEAKMLTESLKSKMHFDNLEGGASVKNCWKGYLNRLQKALSKSNLQMNIIHGQTFTPSGIFKADISAPDGIKHLLEYCKVCGDTRGEHLPMIKDKSVEHCLIKEVA